MSQIHRQSDGFGDRGARACLIPFDEAPAVLRDGVAIPPGPAGEGLLRVLVADNDRDTANSMAALVKLWGHDVRRAYGGAAAFELMLTYRPDVMLLDLAMPQLDGYQLARQVRREILHKNVLLVAITGYGDEAHRRLSEEAGFDLCLTKPVDPSVVERLLLLQGNRLEERPATPAVTTRKYGVLVVDDEEAVRGVLNVALGQLGFVVWSAGTGQEALDLYCRHGAAIDVVLLDVRMPGMDGPRTLAALQRLNPRVRSCFMTGDPGPYSEEGLCGLGAAAVLPKPFRLATTAAVLWDLASEASLCPAGR